MPYKKGSLKGQLTTAEIRKLISAHNKLSKITIPPRSTRDTIMKIISKAGFRVNHEQQKLEQTKATKKDVSLEKAKDITKRIPKTEQQKKKATERKQEKQLEKEKELKLAKKEGVKEFKKKKAEAQKKKPEPKKKAKGVSMGTQTDEKPKEEKKETLQLEDKKKDEKPADVKSQIKEELKKSKLKTDVFPSPIEKPRLTKDGDLFKFNTRIDSEKELLEYVKQFKNVPVVFDNLIFTTHAYDGGVQIRPAQVYKGKLIEKQGEKKTEKSFKVERTERMKMINQLSAETGKKFNPFKILGITAREETPELVKKKCRELRLKNHPDKGGDQAKFDLIQKACKILLDTQTILKKSGN